MTASTSFSTGGGQGAGWDLLVVEVAAHLKIPYLILEEDSLEVISALPKFQKLINWQIQSIIDDIKELGLKL